MGLVYIALVMALALLPLWVGLVYARLASALEERRRRRRAARAWGLDARPVSGLALALVFGLMGRR